MADADEVRIPVALTLIAASLLPAAVGEVTLAGSAGAITCAPISTVLSRTPSTRTLPGGITERIYDTGPTSDPEKSVRVVVLRIPAGSTAIRARVLTSSTLTTSATPGAMINSRTGVVAAVNGGFFNPTRRALPVGAQMVNRVLRKATSSASNVLAVRADGTTAFATAGLSGSATLAGKAYKLTSLNHQALVSGGLAMFTTAWGPQARPYGTVDVVVKSGRITAVRTGTARGKAPASGEVIFTAAGTFGTALSGLRVGQSATWAYHPVVSIPNVVSFVGNGGHYLFKGENRTTCTTRSEELRPRTAYGWTTSGDTVVVTFQGRALRNGVRWGGATNHQVGDYLLKLGVYEAVGLDGGTSTTMVQRSVAAGSVIRIDRANSADAQRPIPDSVALELTGH